MEPAKATLGDIWAVKIFDFEVEDNRTIVVHLGSNVFLRCDPDNIVPFLRATKVRMFLEPLEVPLAQPSQPPIE